MSVWQVTIFMIIVALAFIGIDIWLAVDGLKGNTYSEILRNFDARNAWFSLLLCFGFGLLAGHWWW